MIPFDQVRDEILSAVPRLAARALPIRGATGLALAAPIVARELVPPFANTAMDGYALRALDTSNASPGDPARLRVVAELGAGHASSVPVGAGEAIRIMTGAPLPDGADAIVMVESTERAGDDEVLVRTVASPGDHVRAAGGDMRPGQVVLEAGTVLGPAALGVLASLGVETIEVGPRARVGVMSTGDELVEGPVELAPGQIRDSNRPMLLALVEEAGCEAVDLGTVQDDEERIAGALDRALASCDVVVTSGGVSVGDFDYVKAVLDRLGGLRWFQVAIKPAKPLAFGLIAGTPVFGLPGNPVSSLVSFELFARPALLQMMGHPRRFRPEVRATADAPMRRHADGKIHFDRVRVRVDDSGAWRVARSGGQASNALAALAAADGLAILPDGPGVEAGEPVRVLLLRAPADH